MTTWRLARIGACWLLSLSISWNGPGLKVLADESEEEAIPDKVGAEVHMSKRERQVLKKVECGMCKAILSEMHAEVSKHRMTQKGWGSESGVIETSNAMCLGLLQKYKLDLTREKIEKKAEDEDENMGMGGGGDPATAMRGMLVLKMGCQYWLEDYGGDTAGFVYKSVRDGESTPESSAKEFCHVATNQCGKGKKQKKQAEKDKSKEREMTRRELRKKEDAVEAKAQEEHPFNKLPKDSMANLQRMLEMAKDDPLHYMDDAAKLKIQQGQKDLRCDVCRAAVEQVHLDVMKRPKSMRAEFDILPFFEGGCEGGKDTSVPSYFGVDPPPLAPQFTDRYRPKLDKKASQYKLKPITPKAAKKRRKWRDLTVTGEHKPPGPEEHEGDMMMTMACKDALEPARMAEVLYEQIEACGKKQHCDAALATARLTCRSEDEVGEPCVFEDAGIGSKGMTSGKAEEL